MMHLRKTLTTLAMASVIAMTGTAQSAPGTGIGGTGKPATHNGIGGTGKPATGIDGIGGTGKTRNGNDGIGGTGIIGTIEDGDGDSGIGGTGLKTAKGSPRSIRVNGINIRISPKTSIDLLGNGKRDLALAAGQLVMVETPETGQRITARRIRIVHAVSGPVSQVNVFAGQIRVLGQTVSLRKTTVLTGLDGRRIKLADIRPGQHVRVSGLRNSSGIIQATRISQSGAIRLVSLTGAISVQNDGLIRIAGLTINLDRFAPAGLQTGNRIYVKGYLKHGKLVPVSTRKLPAVPFAGRYRRIIFEGYASGKPGTNKLIRVSNLPLQLLGTTLITGGALTRDAHVRVISRVTRNRMTAIRIHVERPGPVTRRITTPVPRKAITGDRDHHERPETEKPEVEKPETEKPEVEKPEVERPEAEKPEVEKPDVERPEAEKPEVEKPDVERPEVEKPEVEKPEVERPEVERPEVEKPEIERPED